MQNHLRATLLGAALAGGLFVSFTSAPASACPGSKRSESSPPVADQASKADANQMAAVRASANTECAYAHGNRQCAGMSFGSKLLASSLPAGLLAFGLGWATGGRRKRKNSDQA